MPTDDQGAILHLTAAGVSVLIDATDSLLPAIIHWGAELPALTPKQAETLIAASVPVTSSNTVDLPPRPGLLPGHHSGWTGRPGLRGSFDGIGWSPKFSTQTVALNGTPVTGFTSSGPGLLEISALDDAERLRLDLTLALVKCFVLFVIVSNRTFVYKCEHDTHHHELSGRRPGDPLL